MTTSRQADSITEAIVTAVADEIGADPTELHPPLYDVIDPDALEDLFRDGNGRVSFRYQNLEVTVAGDGTVEVGSTGDAAAGT